MSYDTTLTIQLNVDGGPPAMKETSKIDGVVSVFSKRVSFCSTNRTQPDIFIDKERRLQRKHVLLGEPTGVESLSFVSIKANRYTYKHCGKKIDPEGVAYTLDDATPPTNNKPSNANSSSEVNKEQPPAPQQQQQQAKTPTPSSTPLNYIRNEKVLVSFPGCDNLSKIKTVYLYVDEDLFDCSKKDPDEIILTVTWGIKSSAETPEQTCAANC